MKPFKICFVSVHTYPVINPNAKGLFGGMETISWDFARGIAALPNTEVSFVVTHREAPRRSLVNGVQVFEATDSMEWYRQDLSQARQAWRASGTIPWLSLGTLGCKLAAYLVTRPFRVGAAQRWQTPSHWLTNLDADIYVAFGVNVQAEWAYRAAKSIGRPLVVSLMSDFDADKLFHDDPNFVNQYGVTSTVARTLLRECDGLVSQTMRQQRQLKDVWKRESRVISSPLDLAIWDDEMRSAPPENTPAQPFVLWVGRADRFHKRPLIMLHAIEANPQIQFVMVLNGSDDTVLAEVHDQCPPNLTIIPQVSTRQMAALMHAASVFATSSSLAFEGLPSVLLQAAAARNPIVSLEVSAEWLNASGAGVCLHGDQEAFAQTIARLLNDRNVPEVQQYSDAGRNYVEREHEYSQQSTRFLNYLQTVVNETQSRQTSSSR